MGVLNVPEEILTSGPVTLVLEMIEPGNFKKGLSPYYHFKILNESKEPVGTINFRIGDSEHILKAAGHVGYYVYPDYRGCRYSFYACRALIPLISQFYNEVILTVDPDNVPSIAIIESLKAEYIETMVVSEDDPAFKGVPVRKRRYVWNVAASLK